MVRFFHYLRQCFCKHALEREDVRCEETYHGEIVREGVKVVLYCKKCGYHTSFWKGYRE